MWQLEIPRLMGYILSWSVGLDVNDPLQAQVS